MHTPDGFLTNPVCAATAVTSAAALAVGFARARQSQDARPAVWMAATGAGIFAAQMVNFPIEQGTSGHLLGAALAAIALGPWRGMLTMAVVIVAQCLLFGDGGASALGANLLNMAVAGTLTAGLVYSVITQRAAGNSGKLLGTAAASMASVLAAAALCAAELAASGTYHLGEVMAAMLRVHALIGVAEALVSTAIVAVALWVGSRAISLSRRQVAFGSLAIAALIVIGLAPLASNAPDGLERVALDLNFAALASDSWAIAPDYALPGITWPTLALSLAGVLGVVGVFVSSYLVSRTATAKVRKH